MRRERLGDVAVIARHLGAISSKLDRIVWLLETAGAAADSDTIKEILAELKTQREGMVGQVRRQIARSQEVSKHRQEVADAAAQGRVQSPRR